MRRIFTGARCGRSGERARPECWSRRPAATDFLQCCIQARAPRPADPPEKVRFGGTPKPAPGTGALPGVPPPRAFSFLHPLAQQPVAPEEEPFVALAGHVGGVFLLGEG